MNLQPNKQDAIVLPITNTRISASEWNQLVASCMAFITAAGLTPDAADNEQFLNAFKIVAANLELIGANTNLSNLTATGEAKFNAKVDLDAANLSDAGKSLISGLGMPSTVYDTLTLGSSGDEYTASANGYFNIYIYPVTATGYVKIQNTSTTFECETRTTVNNTSVWAFCPARKGEKVKVYYDFAGTTSFKFHYAEGSKQEA